jgi:ethanolamine transporter EutH
MKKLMLVLSIVLATVAGAYAGCMGPYCYDDTGASIQSGVSLQGPLQLPEVTVTASTPTVNHVLGVTAAGLLYVSTNTTNTAGWVKVGAQ